MVFIKMNVKCYRQASSKHYHFFDRLDKTDLPCTGIAISSLPKNSFWKPPLLPGWTTQAMDGVSLPAGNDLVKKDYALNFIDTVFRAIHLGEKH